MKRVGTALNRWLRATWRSATNGGRVNYVLCRVTQHPEDADIENGVIYVLMSGRWAKWAYFRCPCPQHDIVRLNLSQNKGPRWFISKPIFGATSIEPSIRQNDGCRSHFWIRNGRVVWCGDSGLALHL